MIPKDDQALPGETETKPFRDDQTEKRINEHLNNKNDLISEEDISNVKTNIGEEEPVAAADPEEE